MAATEATRGSWIERYAALGGVLYVVFFVVGSILSYHGQPDTGSPPERIIAYYSDSGHRGKLFLGWLLVLLGVFFFLWFVGALRSRLQLVDGGGTLSTVVNMGGAAYAGCTLVAVSVNTAIKTMSDDTYRHQVYPELIHAADDAGYIIHSAGGAGIGAMMIAATILAMRGRIVPAWLGWLGILAGVAAVVSIFFIPWFGIALWILVASGLLVRGRAPDQGAQSEPR